MLDVAELTKLLNGYRQSLFRLETLPAYEVATDGTDYQRYMQGATEPTWDRKRPWLEQLAAERAAGKYRARVRLLDQPLTAYQQYACDWGYALNAQAGEKIRVTFDQALRVYGDFWVIDQAKVVAMHYAPDLRFVGATVLPDGHLDAYLDLAEVAWDQAQPFGPWWHQHPELHRAAA